MEKIGYFTTKIASEQVGVSEKVFLKNAKILEIRPKRIVNSKFSYYRNLDVKKIKEYINFKSKHVVTITKKVKVVVKEEWFIYESKMNY
jgi:hypothetical protein